MQLDVRSLSIMTWVAASLIACNAIVGVTDVTLRQSDSTSDGGDDGNDQNDGGPDNNDGGAIDSSMPQSALLQVVGGAFHTCAKSVTGDVKCWGDNTFGQVGNGQNVAEGSTGASVRSPTAVTGLPTGVLGLGNGFNHTCAIKPDSTVACWGANDSGQLGDGKKVPQSATPLNVSGVANIVQVRGGLDSTCAVTQSGTVQCWGANDGGQCGNNTKNDALTPVTVSALTDAMEVGVGGAHACALRRTGGVVCWGQNEHGQLGNGFTMESLVPVPVQLSGSAIHVSVGFDFACAVLATGHVTCWGENDYGQLGNGTSTTSGAATPTPAAVTSVTDATQIATGQYHACILRSNGSVQCWGANDFGELGDGQRVMANMPTPTPQDVVGVTNAAGIGSILGLHECAPTKTGLISCWGSNSDGQLGEDSEVSQELSPVNAVGYP